MTIMILYPISILKNCMNTVVYNQQSVHKAMKMEIVQRLLDQGRLQSGWNEVASIG